MGVVSDLEEVSVPFVTSHTVHGLVFYYTGRSKLHNSEFGRHHVCYCLCFKDLSGFLFSWRY